MSRTSPDFSAQKRLVCHPQGPFVICGPLWPLMMLKSPKDVGQVRHAVRDSSNSDWIEFGEFSFEALTFDAQIQTPVFVIRCEQDSKAQREDEFRETQIDGKPRTPHFPLVLSCRPGWGYQKPVLTNPTRLEQVHRTGFAHPTPCPFPSILVPTSRLAEPRCFPIPTGDKTLHSLSHPLQEHTKHTRLFPSPFFANCGQIHEARLSFVHPRGVRHRPATTDVRGCPAQAIFSTDF